MDRANELSQAVQKKIQVAIGDISSYLGGYSDGSSSATGSGSGNNINSISGLGMGSGGHSGGSGGGGVSSSSSVSGNGSGSGGKVGGLFKKGHSIGSKSAKNANTIGEFTDYLNDEDLAAIDHQLTTAADLYCKAAGVFEYVAQEMIPRWNKSMAAAVVIHESSIGSHGSTLGKALSSTAAAMKALSESSRPVDVQTCVVSSHIK